jgi:hypothetical protein
MTTSSPPKVPFVEELTLNEVNNWARSPKRALSRAGFMQWGEFTNVWGVNSVRACKAFQKAVRLKQTGTYTFATHEALRKRRKKGSRTEWAFDALAIAIAANNDITPLERVMFKTVDAIDYAILHRDKMLYDQIRLMRDMDPPPNVPNPCDCSQFVTWALKSGGAPDPNHLGYSGAGFTGTLWNNEKVSGLSSARLCDLVFYGIPWMAGGRAHVAIVREIGSRGVLVGSMGSDKGPLNIRADYRQIVGIRRPVLL